MSFLIRAISIEYAKSCGRLGNNHVQGLGNRGIAFSHGDRIDVFDLVEQLLSRRTLNGRCQTQKLVHRHAKRIDVGPLTWFLDFSIGLLR